MILINNKTPDKPGFPAVLVKFDQGTLLIDEPPVPARSLFKGIPFKKDPRVAKLRCDAMYYSPVKRVLESKNIPCDDQCTRWVGLAFRNLRMPTLRSEQAEAVGTWMDSGKGLIVMPTGTGKTVVAIEIIKRLALSMFDSFIGLVAVADAVSESFPLSQNRFIRFKNHLTVKAVLKKLQAVLHPT